MTRDPGGPDDTDGRRVPALVVFDVFGTLSDLSGLARSFTDIGAPAHLAETWFASLLRDGFGLAAMGRTAPFIQLAASALRAELSGRVLRCAVEDAITEVLRGFERLDVHGDVSEAVSALSAMDVRLVTLSNGSVGVGERLLERAGVVDRFERLLSSEDAGVWKPASGAYAYAVRECGVEPADAMVVAVHPWDVAGADRAGLRTAWVNRTGAAYPDYFARPDVEVRSLTALAEVLGR